MAAMKFSRQRESIKEFLRGRTDHPTADTVYENVRLIYPKISLGTVYRNLSLLSDIGEIQKLESFGSSDRFDARIDPHCHFMCTSCGRVLDMDEDYFDQLMADAASHFTGGEITHYSASFYGICQDCKKKEHKDGLQ